MKGLALFTHVSGGGINIASWHSPHSLTWSWILSIRRQRNGEGRWLGFHLRKTNVGTQWMLQFAHCTLQWHRQRPMWYREMWNRKRAREDSESYERYLMRSAEAGPNVGEGSRTLQ